jgi:hypothetical protein
MFNFENEKYIAYTLTTEDLEVCREKAKAMGELKHSIIQGRGNLTGFVGELAVHRYLAGSQWVSGESYDYDIIYGQTKIDVKTKWCNGYPEDTFDCSIAAYNTKQKCDSYVFCRVTSEKVKDYDNPSTVYILGHMNKIKYFENARLWKKGECDATNNHIFTVDTYNCKIRDIFPMPRKKEKTLVTSA